MRTVAFGAILISASALGANWPQWRGIGGSGVSPETGLPTEWSDTKNVAWKTAIPGRGHSSPVVWGNRIFLTTSVEGDVIEGKKVPIHKLEGQEFRHPDSLDGNRRHTLKVLAVDAATGKIVWDQTVYDGPVYDDRHKKNTYATPTPVTDGKAVYVSFESQGVYAFDLKGKLLWKTVPGQIATIGMGPGSSPVLVGDRLVLLFDQDEGEGSFLCGLSTKNGEMVWRADRKGETANWSTPILVNNLVIVSGTKNVIAYDPKSGKEVWKTKGVEGNSVPSPVAGLDMVFASAGYPTKRAYGIKLTGEGDRIAWQYDKGTAYVPSPILYGDYLYLVTDRGLLTCLEARTGKVIYEGKRVPKPATFSASIVAWDGKLFLPSEDGEIFVIKAGPEHEVLGTNPMGEPIHATPAMANGRVYIRTNQHLFCITSSSSRGTPERAGGTSRRSGQS